MILEFGTNESIYLLVLHVIVLFFQMAARYKEYLRGWLKSFMMALAFLINSILDNNFR